MMTAAEAKSVSDAVNNNTPIDPLLIDERYETGNLILDELDHAAIWAARAGLYNAYLDVSKYPKSVRTMAVDELGTLGYNVDITRLRSENEIHFSWN